MNTSPVDSVVLERHPFLELDRVLVAALSVADEDAQRRIIWERVALALQPGEPFSGRGFVPHYQPFGGVAVDPNTWSAEMWQFLIGRAEGARLAVVRAHYADLAWSFKHLHRKTQGLKHLTLAVEAYREAAEELRPLPFERVHVSHVLGRAAEIASRVPGQLPMLLGAVDALVAEAERRAHPGEAVSYLDYVVKTFGVKAVAASPIFSRTCRLLEEAAAASESPDFAELAAGLLVDAHQAAGTGLVVEQKRRLALVYARRATQDEARSKLVAGHWCQKALAVAVDVGDAELTRRMKDEIRRLTREGTNELKRVRVSAPISKAAVRAEVEVLMAPGDWRSRFGLVATDPRFAPSLAAAQRYADGIVNNGNLVLLNMIQEQVQTEDRPVGRAVTMDEKRSFRVREYLLMSVENAVEIYWVEFLALASERGLTSENMLASFVEADLIPSGHAPLLGRGIAQYFAGDYVSAAHILVPQFEAALRHVAHRAGGDTTTYRPESGGRLQERTMGGLFEERIRPALERELGEDAIATIESIFTDEAKGMNIRNRVAHGMLDAEQFTERLGATVLLGFVLLFRADRRGASARDEQGASEK